MALLEVLTFPDPVLRAENAPVTTFDEEFRQLVQDMAETMYANDGIGLAAPQVGVNINLIILDVGPGEERGRHLLALANPKIIDGDGAIEWDEGCLSLPEVTVRMQRHAKVTIAYQDPDGNDMEIEGDELLAVALQHEMDHLKGQLLIDYLPPLKRRLVTKELKRIKEHGPDEYED
jgi:peptide deformylase